MKSINWSQTILLALMITAVPVGLLTIISIIVPGWPWLAIVWLGLATAVEALSTTIWLGHHNQLGLNKSYYRAAEFIVLALIMRLFTWTLNGNWPQFSQWRSYLLTPSILFDGYFIVAILILFLIWTWANVLANIFHHLEISRAESSYYERAHAGSDRPMPLNRVTLVETFLQHWLIGGIFLVICAALTTFNLTELTEVQNPLAIGRLGLRPHLLIAILTYFLSGLWLLSQARLSVMKARWLTGRVAKQEPVERSWQRTSFITLLVVAGLATLLPIGSTFFISRILNVLIVSLIFLLNLIVFAFSTLLVAVLSLFGRQPAEGGTNEPLRLPEDVFAGADAPLPNDTPSLIVGSIFWLAVLAMAIVALVFFWRERGYRLPSWRQMWQAVRGWLHQWWYGLAAQVARWQQPATTTANGSERKRPFRLPFRFLRLNNLSPRQQITYFYLSTVRRASERGIPRQPHETPLEYAHSLREELPQETADVTHLTDAFLQARYSLQPVETEEATAVKPIWQRLRAAIKQKRAR
ncbi:MAG: DUF4129 domain-containing protein [Ardenticatenaceae bacterium]|nr:DUF4129 domain-containing protein [Ardenticatenaceae bacterium]